MPNKMNLRFRDPSTGQMHTVQGEVVKKMTRENPQSTSELRNDPNDGKIDLFVHGESKQNTWYSSSLPNSYHLQVDTSAMSDEQVKALAEAVRSGGKDAISIGEGYSFNPVNLQTDLWVEKSEVLGMGGHNPDVSINTSEEAPVFLSANGQFSTQPGEPADMKAAIDGLYRAAEAGDSLAEGENIFSRNGVSLEGRQRVMQNIGSLLEDVNNSTLSSNEKAQARSSAATVLTEMVSSLGNRGPEGELKSQAFNQLHDLIGNETVAGLKESMIFNAIRVQPGLGDEDSAKVSELRKAIAPESPPYEKWFEDGELNISMAAGHGEGFYDGITELLEKQGFEMIEEGSRHGWRGDTPRIMQMKKTVNGEERTVNIHIRDFDNDSFKDINDDKMDILVYQGHSNLGQNTRKSVDNAPDSTGKDKLIFLGLCSGKDNLDRVRKAFPEAQLMTTFNSSYFHTKPIAGGDRQFTDGEDAKALMQLIKGSLAEQPWSEINDNIRDKAVGYNHKDKVLGNYISPIDLQIANRFRDEDSDGQADLLDRHFNIETLEVRPGAHSSFEPRPADNDGQKLNGDLPHLAAGFANTIDLYNPTYDKFSHKGRILADGYYKGAATDPIVKFDTTVENGQKVYTMKVNDQYAHMGEEALRALTMVEYNKHLAETESDYPVKDKMKSELVGLLTAAASLSYDSGYRDAAVFEALVDHYGLPEGLKWSDAGYLIDKEKHDYTGSVRMAEKWIDKMDPATLEALKAHFNQ
jgi:hypothetical protein